MAISLQQLRYLAAVADQGSLTAAAAHLGVTQPVLSRGLAALQEELDAPLLRRSNRKLVLTPDGEAALGPARRAIAAVDDVKRTALRKQAPPLLRLAANTTLTAVGGVLKTILDAHPDMHVKALPADTVEAMAELLSTRQADLGLGERPTAAKDLRWVPLDQLEMVLVSPPGLDLPAEIEMRQLAELRLICPPASTPRQRGIDDVLLRAGVRPNVILELEEHSILAAMARAGVGSYFAWRINCAHIVGVDLRSFRPRYMVDIGFSYLRNPSPQVREFIDLATAHKRTASPS